MSGLDEQTKGIERNIEELKEFFPNIPQPFLYRWIFNGKDEVYLISPINIGKGALLNMRIEEHKRNGMRVIECRG